MAWCLVYVWTFHFCIIIVWKWESLFLSHGKILIRLDWFRHMCCENNLLMSDATKKNSRWKFEILKLWTNESIDHVANNCPTYGYDLHLSFIDFLHKCIHLRVDVSFRKIELIYRYACLLRVFEGIVHCNAFIRNEFERASIHQKNSISNIRLSSAILLSGWECENRDRRSNVVQE